MYISQCEANESRKEPSRGTKVDKLREQNEKVKYEIQNIAYDKEKIKQEAVAKFAAGF